MFANEDNPVNEVRRIGGSRHKEKHNVIKSPETKKKTPDEKQEQQRGVCGNCGLMHSKGQFPALRKQCNKCKKMNHYARM